MRSHFRSISKVILTWRYARCPFWLPCRPIAALDEVSSASVFVTREGLMDRFAIERGAGSSRRERVVGRKRIRNTWSMRPFSRSPRSYDGSKTSGIHNGLATNARWTDLRDCALAQCFLRSSVRLSDRRDTALPDDPRHKTLNYEAP